MDRLLDLRSLTLALNGTPTYLGTIASIDGSSTTNATTAAPFDIPAGSILILQSVLTDGFYVSFGDGSVTTSAETGVQIGFPTGPEQYRVILGSEQTHVAISYDASCTCKIFRLS